jgi:hypothetical protein
LHFFANNLQVKEDKKNTLYTFMCHADSTRGLHGE